MLCTEVLQPAKVFLWIVESRSPNEELLPNQYPWQVAPLNNKFSSSPFCGGSLLSSDTVLSAAHWANSYSLPYVGFAKDDVTLQNAEKIQASQVIPHPYYGYSGSTNDFAIIKLSTPVMFDKAHSQSV